MTKGKFYVIGTGPGGPRQTTLEALECMEKADVFLCSSEVREKFRDILGDKPVLYDPWAGLFDFKGKPWRKLVASEPSLVEEFKRERVRLREEIVQRIQGEMREGRNVALIETGDPCLFGPSHWFIEGLDPGDVEIVPGVGTFSAAMAVLKKSSIPSHDTRFVVQTSPMSLFTPGEDDGVLDALQSFPSTMIFYMGLWNLEGLAGRLKEKLPADLPAAIVYHAGSREKQRVVEGTLENIADKAKEVDEDFAGLIVLGRCLTGNGYRSVVENMVRV